MVAVLGIWTAEGDTVRDVTQQVHDYVNPPGDARPPCPSFVAAFLIKIMATAMGMTT